MPNDLAFTELLPGPGHNAPPLEEVLIEQSAALVTRRDDLLSAVDRAPAVIVDEEMCGKVADLVRLISACTKAAEAQRVAAKEPFLAGGRLADAVYKRITDPLDKAKRNVEERLTAYQRAKADAERRRREEEARRQAEEAARQRAEAEAAAVAAATEQDLDTAISVEEQARQTTADAITAQKAADVNAAELSRSRGDYGAVASLATWWDFTNLERAKLDLETLRPFIPMDGLEKAVRAFVKSGGRELRGVEIFQQTGTRVR